MSSEHPFIRAISRTTVRFAGVATPFLLAVGAGAAEGGGERALRLPDPPARYVEPPPAYFADAGAAAFDTTPDDNPTTDAGATLGRALFHDKRLSGNGTISCASCHDQRHAFADPRRFSVGFQGQETDRNAMALTDLRYGRAGFFWDERAPSLERAVLQPLFSHVEMGQTPDGLVAVLTADPRYPELFRAAFGSEKIDQDRTARALSQFIRAIVSRNSRYDREAAKAVSAGEDFAGFTASENLGKRLFFKRCAACHRLGTNDKVAIFAMFRSLNNGVDPNAEARDGGRGDVTFNPSDVGLFRPSSLRNVEFTAPYMHDGRFATLEDVVEHYSAGVRRHPTVGPVNRMQLDAEEKAGLVAFLKTLGDHDLVVDERFSDPWSDPSDSGAAATPAAAVAPPVADPAPSGDRALAWLRGLDADGDGALSVDEYADVVRKLVDLGVSIVPRDRSLPSARRRPRGEEDRPDAPAEPPPAADFDGDGTVSPEEGRRYLAMKRLIELEDGGRLEVFLDRILAGPGFSPDQSARARSSLRAAKQALNARTRGLDLDVARDLEALLGPDRFDRFRGLVVDSRVVRDRSSRDDDGPALELAREEVAAYDRDEDGRLDEAELRALARALDAVPGGFGRERPANVDIRLFADRILKFDADGDGRVAPDELPERLRIFAVEGDADGDGRLDRDEAAAHFRRAAFERLLETGIYVGGAFANLLPHAIGLLDDLDLPADTLARARSLIRDHERNLAEASARVVEEQTRAFQEIARSRR